MKKPDLVLVPSEIDQEVCLPDKIIKRPNGLEAWVYEHGNIAELVIVDNGERSD